MKKMDKNTPIVLFDGFTVSAVYKGALSCLVNVTEDLKWHHDETHDWLTLKEIEEQLEGFFITVISENATFGAIYQYGNYLDGSWWCIGRLDGYA